jgi:hypothetical protein
MSRGSMGEIVGLLHVRTVCGTATWEFPCRRKSSMSKILWEGKELPLGWCEVCKAIYWQVD